MLKIVNVFLSAVTLISTSISTCAADDRELTKVGVVLPLSGPLAEMGTSFRRGVEMYTSEHPDMRVSFHFEDDRYEGKNAVTAIHALRGSPGIDMAIVWGNTPAGAVAPVAEQQKIPTLTISNGPDAKGRKYVVSLGFSTNTFAERVAQQFREGNITEVGAVTIDVGSALECVDKISQRLDATLFKKVVANEEVDFKAIIPQLKSRKIQGIALFLLPQQALTFLSQAKQFDYHPMIVGGDVFALESFRHEAAQLSRRISYIYGSVTESFIKKLASSPGSTSYFFEAATGYSLAAVSAALAARWRTHGKGDDPLGELKSVSLSNLPLPKILYQEDAVFGRHFEVDIEAYSASR